MRRYLVGQLAILLLVCAHPGAVPGQEVISVGEERVSLTSGLVLSGASRGGRVALHQDAVEALLLTQPERIFRPDEAVSLDAETTRNWQAVTAGEDGQFAGRQFFRSYLQFVVESAQSRVMILDAHGHGSAIINGEPRGGDTYNRWHQIPVSLRAGRNQLLFQVGRGRFRGTLAAPPQPVYLVPHDLTLADWLRGSQDAFWAAMPVMNASAESLHDLSIRTSINGAHARTTSLGPILPLTLRKVGFAIGPAADLEGDEVTVTVELLRRGADEPIDTHEVQLPMRHATDRHRRTFVSQMDGSVQYYAVTPASADAGDQASKPGLFLSLHGAGVEAQGQAAVYQPKPEGHVVAPTNRRAFGFDWEDWGRGDALEVLADAQQHLAVDPQQIFLTGHSMGGHGTWQIGATFPDRFAAIGPSAGWVSFWSYAGGVRNESPSPIEELLQRAASPSDTLQLARNYASYGVYVLHGDRDNNVPVGQARTMRSVLGEFHPDFVYYERPGAGHWWGNACCDWPPMFDFFRRHRTPPPHELADIDFTTMSPGVSARYGWATVADQRRPLRASRIQLRLDRGQATLTGTTENVAVLNLALDAAFAEPPDEGMVGITLDGTELQVACKSVWLSRRDQGWQLAERPTADRKNPRRYGLFKSAFDHRFVLVYGTQGTAAENQWSLAKVRYDAETFWYRGNGSVDVVADRDFRAEDVADRSVILYGNADTNAAWNQLLADCPLRVTRDSIELEQHKVRDPRLAALFVYPRPDSEVALVGAVGGTGIEGLRATNRLRYFVSGVAYPDITITSADFLSSGNDALVAAGYWDSRWQGQDAEILWDVPTGE